MANGNRPNFAKVRRASQWGIGDYTALNAKRGDILKEVYSANLLDPPLPTRGPKGPYKNRWRPGTEGPRRDNTTGRRANVGSKQNEPTEENIRGTMTTIAGGFIGGGTTSSARRRYARSVMQISEGPRQQATHRRPPVITFSEDDFDGVEEHEHDPMVIEVRVANYKVQRVLVDQGSSADILYWRIFKKLGLSQDCLLPFAGSLIGFAGDSIDVRGRYGWMGDQDEDEQVEAPLWVYFAELNPGEGFREDMRSQPIEELSEVKIGESADKVTKIGMSLDKDLAANIVKLLQENKDLFAWSAENM
ncbi:hypothetical protein SESBI_01808 [Sesbania bispinosa]|nr:hypothetical protein SESBI_01808 [Sesbania bispinosa]